jgi:putative phosphoribosyl transferase
MSPSGWAQRAYTHKEDRVANTVTVLGSNRSTNRNRAQRQGKRRYSFIVTTSFEVEIPLADDIKLGGTLNLPAAASGVVLFAHGSGSSRHSPRNRFVAETLNHASVATLLFDLLTRREEMIDMVTAELRFNIALLAERLVAVTDWAGTQPQIGELLVGYFGSSTGGAAALMAAVERSKRTAAVVCRGSRTDLAEAVLPRVEAPTLFIVGENDEQVLAWNRESFAQLRCEKELTIIAGATHLFEETGALEQVAQHASAWFRRHFSGEKLANIR